MSRFPGITAGNVAEDGATIGDVFGSQLPQVAESEERTLLTLSIGGNDLLSAFANKPIASLLRHVVKDIGEAYEFLVDSLKRRRPNSLLIVTTVYDPSDDTRKIPGVFDGAGPLPLESLHDLNARIGALAASAPETAVADAYRHFLGHGVTAPEPERWFWRRSWVEPSALGASEIRRLWLDALPAEAKD